MFCKLNSYSINGIDAVPIEVEIDLHDGLPGFDIVGLPDCAVREAKERVKSAIKNSGFPFPICHITVNLAPADIKKEGSLYDLPIALGILGCLGQLPLEMLKEIYFVGELALDGSLRPVRGLLPLLCAMKEKSHCIIPVGNENEATLVHHLKVNLAHHLKEVIEFIHQTSDLPSCSQNTNSLTTTMPLLDFSDVKGQESAKRGLMLCAAGYHNAILIGPPGSGKTMLAKRLPSILPTLTESQSIEVTKIYSVAHQLGKQQIIKDRPFRAPHHTISALGLSGGGSHPKPGEISLAHLGVLFLDELLEFNRHTLEILRQPIETHEITLSRAQSSLTYPADFLFLASTNPCPCGYYPNPQKCTCSLSQIKKYISKLSGPLIDRIDIHLETHTPSIFDLKNKDALSSNDMREKVSLAQARQAERFKGTPYHYNSQIPTHMLKTYCHLTSKAEDLLNDWFQNSSSSIRVYDKILRIALTISDVDNSDEINVPHIAEALEYRVLDRNFWA